MAQNWAVKIVGETFEGFYRLKRHFQGTHKKLKPHQSDKCHKAIGEKETLRVHFDSEEDECSLSSVKWVRSLLEGTQLFNITCPEFITNRKKFQWILWLRRYT